MRQCSLIIRSPFARFTHGIFIVHSGDLICNLQITHRSPTACGAFRETINTSSTSFSRVHGRVDYFAYLEQRFEEDSCWERLPPILLVDITTPFDCHNRTSFLSTLATNDYVLLNY